MIKKITSEEPKNKPTMRDQSKSTKREKVPFLLSFRDRKFSSVSEKKLRIRDFTLLGSPLSKASLSLSLHGKYYSLFFFLGKKQKEIKVKKFRSPLHICWPNGNIKTQT